MRFIARHIFLRTLLALSLIAQTSSVASGYPTKSNLCKDLESEQAAESVGAQNFPTPLLIVAKTEAETLKAQGLDQGQLPLDRNARLDAISATLAKTSRYSELAAKAQLEITRLSLQAPVDVAALYETTLRKRLEIQTQLEQNPSQRLMDRMQMKISDELPNLDEFGSTGAFVDLEVARGTLGYSIRVNTGALIAEQHFSSTSPQTLRGQECVGLHPVVAEKMGELAQDVTQNTFQLEVDGTLENFKTIKFYRNAAAREIGDSWNTGSNLSKAPEFVVLTETASVATQTRIRKIAFDKLQRMLERRDAGLNVEKQEFDLVLYLLYHSPLYKRGSDAVIRIFMTSMHSRLFGEPVTLPHDIDLQAYARTLDSFLEWSPTAIRRGRD